MRTLLLGANGQLGRAFARRLENAGPLAALTHAELDVTDHRALEVVVRQVAPELILNCAAYTNVDGAEDEPARALAVNAWAPRALARLAGETGAALVHFSTDFVFDGRTPAALTEDAPPNPQSVYAVSKLVGEWFAAGAARHYVLRVESLFGGDRGGSSVDRLLADILAGRVVRAFSDRTVSPSAVGDVVRATLALVERRAPYGVYHCVNTGETTWLALVRELARVVGHPDATITAMALDQARLRARRPQYAALSNAKLRAAGIEMPTWQQALQEAFGRHM